LRRLRETPVHLRISAGSPQNCRRIIAIALRTRSGGERMAGERTQPAVLQELRAWFESFGKHVAAVDFANARTMFSKDAQGFGTYTDVLDGRDAIEREQWRTVWPTIADFRFDLERLSVRASPDGLLAVAMVTFDSTGFAADGTGFDRPGRATLAFVREGPQAPWHAVHSHFSLNRGVLQRSFGERLEAGG
jgi:ketosteroid isomerase-like protein